MSNGWELWYCFVMVDHGFIVVDPGIWDKYQQSPATMHGSIHQWCCSNIHQLNHEKLGCAWLYIDSTRTKQVASLLPNKQMKGWCEATKGYSRAGQQQCDSRGICWDDACHEGCLGPHDQQIPVLLHGILWHASVFSDSNTFRHKKHEPSFYTAIDWYTSARTAI